MLEDIIATFLGNDIAAEIHKGYLDQERWVNEGLEISDYHFSRNRVSTKRSFEQWIGMNRYSISYPGRVIEATRNKLERVETYVRNCNQERGVSEIEKIGILNYMKDAAYRCKTADLLTWIPFVSPKIRIKVQIVKHCGAYRTAVTLEQAYQASR
jgi:hypothetical protein